MLGALICEEELKVALLAEGVGRNPWGMPLALQGLVALLAEGVGRNRSRT